jgi:type III secretion protein J
MRRLLALVAVCALVALTGCSVPVATALDEPDANRVVVALDQVGIDGSKEPDPIAEGKFRITVARDDAARALQTMRDEDLPRAKPRGLADAADRGQLVPSQAAEHAQLVAGLAGELERTLGSIEGVLAARVHLNLPQKDLLRDAPAGKATASVLVEHRGTTPPLAPESIQRLVAGGAPGLAPTDVAVVFVPRTPKPNANRQELAHVGPISVAKGSATILKGTFAGIVAVVLALAAVVLALYARLGKVQRERELDLAAASARLPPRSTQGGQVPASAHAPGAMSARPPGPAA